MNVQEAAAPSSSPAPSFRSSSPRRSRSGEPIGSRRRQVDVRPEPTQLCRQRQRILGRLGAVEGDDHARLPGPAPLQRRARCRQRLAALERSRADGDEWLVRAVEADEREPVAGRRLDQLEPRRQLGRQHDGCRLAQRDEVVGAPRDDVLALAGATGGYQEGRRDRRRSHSPPGNATRSHPVPSQRLRRGGVGPT